MYYTKNTQGPSFVISLSSIVWRTYTGYEVRHTEDQDIKVTFPWFVFKLMENKTKSKESWIIKSKYYDNTQVQERFF